MKKFPTNKALERYVFSTTCINIPSYALRMILFQTYYISEKYKVFKKREIFFWESLLFCTTRMRSKSDTKMKLCQILGELQTYIMELLRGFTFPSSNWPLGRKENFWNWTSTHTVSHPKVAKNLLLAQKYIFDTYSKCIFFKPQNVYILQQILVV